MVRQKNDDYRKCLKSDGNTVCPQELANSLNAYYVSFNAYIPPLDTKTLPDFPPLTMYPQSNPMKSEKLTATYHVELLRILLTSLQDHLQHIPSIWHILERIQYHSNCENTTIQRWRRYQINLVDSFVELRLCCSMVIAGCEEQNWPKPVWMP